MINPGLTSTVSTESTLDDILLAIQDSSSTPATDIEAKGASTVGTTPVELTFVAVTNTISISALNTNLGVIYVGKSDVLSTGANAAYVISAGLGFSIDYDDSSNPLYVVGSIADQEYVAGAAF